MRENIVDIIKVIKKKTGTVHMVSNGSLVTEEKLGLCTDAGLNLIQFSLDGANEWQHDVFRRHPGAFEKVINAIKIAKKLGLKVAISFIPNKLNYKSYRSFIDLCLSLDIEDVRTMPLIPMGRGSQIYDLVLSGEEELEFRQSVEWAKVYLRGTSTMVSHGDPIDHLYRMPTNVDLNFSTYQVEVKSNGKLGLTTYLPIYIGDLHKHSLKEYWDSGLDKIWGHPKIIPYLNKIRTIYDFDKFEPRPFSGDSIEFDLIDNKEE